MKGSRPVRILVGGALLVAVGGWAAASYFPWGVSGDAGADLTARGREIRRLLHQGQRAYEEEAWDEVVRCYRRVVEWDPDHASAWMHLAYGLHRLEQWDNAIAALEECARFSSVKRWALFNLATIYARRDKPREALDYLELAIEEGFQPTRPLTEEPGFQSLLGNSRFQAILERTKPLAERMIGRQLDFLMGEWEIINRAENTIGQVRYESEASGFAVRAMMEFDESRTVSIYYYFEPTSGKWVRTEVDSDGTIYRCEGSFTRPGSRRHPLSPLVLRGERVTLEGKRDRCRVSIMPRTLQRIIVSVEIWDDSRRRWQTDKTVYFVRPTALSINR